MNQIGRNKFRYLFCLFGLIFLLGACAPGAESSATPSPTLAPTCVPSGDKFYTSFNGVLGSQSENASTVANNIYNQYLSSADNLQLAKSQSIHFLAYEAMRWSHIKDVSVDDYNMVRVIVTFISPELVRAVMLNHALFSLYPSPTQDLNSLTNTILTSLDNQNEYFFLISIQPLSLNKTDKTIYIPPDRIVIRDTAATQVYSINNDYFLNQKFDFTLTTHSGFIFFPIATRSVGDICEQVLDPLHDTSITLVIESAVISEQSKTLTWEIPFAPALPVSNALPTPVPDESIASGADIPIETFPGLDITESTEEMAYWKKYGRFIWAKLTLDYFSLR